MLIYNGEQIKISHEWRKTQNETTVEKLSTT